MLTKVQACFERSSHPAQQLVQVCLWLFPGESSGQNLKLKSRLQQMVYDRRHLRVDSRQTVQASKHAPSSGPELEGGRPVGAGWRQWPRQGESSFSPTGPLSPRNIWLLPGHLRESTAKPSVFILLRAPKSPSLCPCHHSARSLGI